MINSVRSLKWLDYLYYVLTDPRILYREIERSGNVTFWLSFIIPLAVSFSDVVVYSIFNQQTNFFYYKISYGWFLIVSVNVLKIIVFSSVIDFAVQYLGSGGKAKKVIVLLNFSLFPVLFFLPVMYIINVFGFGVGAFYSIFAFILFVWTLIIAVLGISEMYSIDTWKALFLYIFPYFFFAILFLFIVITGMFLLKGAFFNFF